MLYSISEEISESLERNIWGFWGIVPTITRSCILRKLYGIYATQGGLFSPDPLDTMMRLDRWRNTKAPSVLDYRWSIKPEVVMER